MRIVFQLTNDNSIVHFHCPKQVIGVASRESAVLKNSDGGNNCLVRLLGEHLT